MMPKTAASTPALQLTTTALPLSFGFFVGVAPPAVPESVAADEPAGLVLDWLGWLVPSAEEPALDSVVVVAVPASVSLRPALGTRRARRRRRPHAARVGAVLRAHALRVVAPGARLAAQLHALGKLAKERRAVARACAHAHAALRRRALGPTRAAPIAVAARRLARVAVVLLRASVEKGGGGCDLGFPCLQDGVAEGCLR
ncbi:hypothetical protein LEL_07684 [Akanthomyces lecanii RCEF 1005]|uniref:Uncharacterized protein n=1 Tax=Akanthomyces lecanii RCEF 1005 TaxID=1081108 RepID=A0A168FW75_CORDF|nr:hypothetical protein LEL_07684 [Akanthomyces lecanii RCEF 1005]